MLTKFSSNIATGLHKKRSTRKLGLGTVGENKGKQDIDIEEVLVLVIDLCNDVMQLLIDTMSRFRRSDKLDEFLHVSKV